MLRAIHPDENESGFIFDAAWCKTCGKAIRLVGTRWFAPRGEGPYCSQPCLDVLGGVWRYDADQPTSGDYDTTST